MRGNSSSAGKFVSPSHPFAANLKDVQKKLEVICHPNITPGPAFPPSTGSLGYVSTQQPMQQMQQIQVRGDRHVTPPPPPMHLSMPGNLRDVQKKLELARMHFNALQQVSTSIMLFKISSLF
jgi:hypothetical protein